MSVVDQIDNRYYDQPNHPHYGPCRRLHVMLMQLTANQSYEAADRLYGSFYDETWDYALVSHLKIGISEAEAQRTVLADILWLLDGRA